MEQYKMYELVLHGEEPSGNQAQVDVWATFRVGNKETHIDGFYDGSGIYKVRFYPKEAGIYQICVDGMVHYVAEEICTPAECDMHHNHAQTQNHGMVHECGLHFKYEDGTWYYPFGTTIYAMAHQDKKLIDTTMKSLSTAGFNKVRFCLFPKDYDFNHNEPDYYAFEKTDGKWDVKKPCFAFWNAFEERIRELDHMGIQGDLILFHPYDRWGFSKFSKEDSLIYLNYLLRRFAAFPNLWWSLANEYDLMPNYQMEDWVLFAQYIKTHDPYHHLLSNHNCFAYWDFSMSEITHCCIQDINMNEVPELSRRYHKPVIFDECRYEGNIIHSWGSLSAKEMTHRFWTAVTYGGYCTHGETYYSEDEVLWWARGGVLKGESYKRIAFLREIIEALPGPLDVVEDGLGSFTVDLVEKWKKEGVPQELSTDFFASHLIKLPKDRIQFFILRHRPCLSHYKEEAYLRYYEKECTSVGMLPLPESHSYRVEVIDTWKMTRTVVEEQASGMVKVSLPGKEGMAILATEVHLTTR